MFILYTGKQDMILVGLAIQLFKHYCLLNGKVTFLQMLALNRRGNISIFCIG